MSNISDKAHSLKYGECPLCCRRTTLTFHHLIPKKMHRRNYFKKNFTKPSLSQGIAICRKCHTGIHRVYSEMELAKHFYNIELLLRDETLQRHFAWVGKQKIS